MFRRCHCIAWISSHPLCKRDLSCLIFESKHGRLGSRGPPSLSWECGLQWVVSRRQAWPLPIVLRNWCILLLQHERRTIAGLNTCNVSLALVTLGWFQLQFLPVMCFFLAFSPPALLTFPCTLLTSVPLSGSALALLSLGKGSFSAHPSALCVSPSSCARVTCLVVFHQWTQSSLGMMES